MCKVMRSIACLAVVRATDGESLIEFLDDSLTKSEFRAIKSTFRTLIRPGRVQQHAWRDMCSCPEEFGGSAYALADSPGRFIVAAGVRDGIGGYPSHLVWEMLDKLVDIVQRVVANINDAKPGVRALLMKPAQKLMNSYNMCAELQDKVTEKSLSSQTLERREPVEKTVRIPEAKKTSLRGMASLMRPMLGFMKAANP